MIGRGGQESLSQKEKWAGSKSLAMPTVYKCVLKRCLPWGVFLLLLFHSLCLTTPLIKKGRNTPNTSEGFSYLRLEEDFKKILCVSLFILYVISEAQPHAQHCIEPWEYTIVTNTRNVSSESFIV